MKKVILAPTKKPTFKVGDWVVIVNSGKNWVTSMDSLTGKTVQIEKVSCGDCISFKNDKGWTWCFCISFKNDKGWAWCFDDGHFRKATKEEVLKAKTPDRELLGYKAPIDYYGGLVKKDSIALVSSKLGTTYAIRSFRLPQEVVETWVKVYKDPEPAFKVGDYIVAKTRCSYLPTGKVAKITKIVDIVVHYSHAAENDDYAPMSSIEKECRLATKTEIAETLKVFIGSFEAVTTRSSVSFAGEKYGKSELESLIKLFEKHPNQIKSLNVGCSGQHKVELSTLKRLLAKLK